MALYGGLAIRTDGKYPWSTRNAETPTIPLLIGAAPKCQCPYSHTDDDDAKHAPHGCKRTDRLSLYDRTAELKFEVATVIEKDVYLCSRCVGIMEWPSSNPIGPFREYCGNPLVELEHTK